MKKPSIAGRLGGWLGASFALTVLVDLTVAICEPPGSIPCPLTPSIRNQ